MKKFNSVIIYDDTFEILYGTNGTYNISDIDKCDVLNEKASKRGKTEPFTALMGVGATGIFQDPYLYVGVRIILKDGTVLAIYTSKAKTQVGTDQYREDRIEAKEIQKRLKR